MTSAIGAPAKDAYVIVSFSSVVRLSLISEARDMFKMLYVQFKLQACKFTEFDFTEASKFIKSNTILLCAQKLTREPGQLCLPHIYCENLLQLA